MTSLLVHTGIGIRTMVTSFAGGCQTLQPRPQTRQLSQMSQREVRAQANYLARHGRGDEGNDLMEAFNLLRRSEE